ncbi:MAG: outer membrane protein assembly factor BamC [Methylococcales bacterium]|nr:outer membrane protein assembly factor BamC [Methylococcales bacterium]
MKIKQLVFLSIALVQLASCSNAKSPRYQDTSELEMPPQMKISEKPVIAAIEKDEKIENKGLGDQVLLAGSPKNPVIKIKKLFDRSWNLVEQALKLSKIKITDKNREQGVFFVKFDPDEQGSSDRTWTESVASLFTDDYEEASYKLTVIWRESDTEVSAEVVNRENSRLLDDDEDIEDFEGSVDSGSRLIQSLYKTIKIDLPLD